MIRQSHFKPAWWMRHPHLQTILPKFYRQSFQVKTHFEQFELPDGDFVELAWTETPTDTATKKPIVIVFHGLEGSINSHYAKGMMQSIKNSGWIGVLMHFRGCGEQTNRHARLYHSGETQDAKTFITHIHNIYPNAPLSAIGFSLGGNVLAKYLGEEKHQTPLKSAIVVSAPLHLASSSNRIGTGSSKIYQKYLLDMLKQTAVDKVKTLKSDFPIKIKPQQIADIKTLMQFDDILTGPLHGFADGADYYERSSGLQYLKYIDIPCLVIHSNDDPFMSKQVIPSLGDLSQHVQYELSTHGGHVGFVAGSNPFRPQYWLEKRATAFFSEHL